MESISWIDTDILESLVGDYDEQLKKARKFIKHNWYIDHECFYNDLLSQDGKYGTDERTNRVFLDKYVMQIV